MITLKSKTKQFKSACIKLGCCKSALDWMALTDDEDSIEILLENYAKDPLANKEWSHWLIEYLGTLLDSDFRKGLLNAISDALIAFNTYIGCINLTEEEDIILKNKFTGKLPTAEEEFKKGLIKREKEKDNHGRN